MKILFYIYLLFTLVAADGGETCFYKKEQGLSAAFYTYWNGINKPANCVKDYPKTIEHQWLGSDKVFNKGSNYVFKKGAADEVGDSVYIYQKSRNDYFHEENALSTLNFEEGNGLKSIYISEYARRAHWNISNSYTTNNFVVNLGPREEVWHSTQIFIEGVNSIFFYNWGYEYILFRRINPDAFVYIAWTTDYYKGAFIRSQRHDTTTQECLYQFTGYKTDKTCDTDNSDFKMMDICSKKENHRYVMCFWSKGQFTDCSCKPKDTSSKIKTSNKFNFPDCQYLSSLYDFSLNPTNTHVTIDTYNTTRWNDLILPNRMDSLEIEITVTPENSKDVFGTKFTDDEKNNKFVALSIETDFKFPQYPFKVLGGLTVNGNVTIETSSEYFVKYLTAKNITVDKEIENKVTVFSGRVMNKDNIDILKKQNVYPVCGENGKIQRFMKLDKQPNETNSQCECTVSDSTSFEEFDCDETSKEESKLIMNMKRSEYNGGDVTRYWQTIKFSGNGQRTLSGKAHVAEKCEFNENRVYNIDTDLKCKEAFVTSQSQIIITGKLEITNLAIQGSGTNMNMNSIFTCEKGEDLKITNLKEITITDSGCIDFLAASSISSFALTLTNGYSSEKLEGKLFRICKGTSVNKEIVCSTSAISSVSFAKDFSKIQCPCSSENCIIEIPEQVSEIVMDKENYNLTGSIRIKGKSLTMKSFKEINKLLFTNKDEFKTKVKVEGSKLVIRNIESEVLDVNKRYYFELTTSSNEVTISNCVSNIQLSLYPSGKVTLDYSNVIILNILETPTTYVSLSKNVKTITLWNMPVITHPAVALFEAEVSSEQLNFTVNMPARDKPIIYNKNRKIYIQAGSVAIDCDNQVLVGLGSTCSKMGIKKHLCYVGKKDNKVVYTIGEVDLTKEINEDYSCNNLTTRTNDIPLEYHVYGGYNEYVYVENGPKIFYLKNDFKLNLSESFKNISFLIYPQNDISTFTVTGIQNTYTIFGNISLSVPNNNIIISGNDNIFIKEKTNSNTLTVTTERMNACSMVKVDSQKTFTCLLNGTYQQGNNTANEKISNCKQYLPSGRCEVCEDNYYLNYSKNSVSCVKLTIVNCIYGNGEKCLTCKDGYVLSQDQKSCSQLSTCSGTNSFSDYCVSCGSGKYGPKCENNCSDNCDKCQNKDVCLVCKDNFVLDSSKKCQSASNATKIQGSTIISCKDGFYLSNNKCEQCTMTGCDNCVSSTECVKCKANYLLINGKCVSTNCPENQYFNSEKDQCQDKPTQCSLVDNIGNCLKCSNDNLYISSDPKQGCISTKIDVNCEKSIKGICVRCINGAYLKDNKCELCKVEGCKRCSNDGTCGYCQLGYQLSNGKCYEYGVSYSTKASKQVKTANEIKTTVENCAEYAVQSCSRCNEGYYVSENTCKKCSDTCQACSNDGKCTKCKADQYLTSEGKCDSLTSLKNNKHCLSTIGNNCQICEIGYYIKTSGQNKECGKCNELLPNCLECDGGKKTCSKCDKEYVLLGGECKHYKEISHCLSALDGDCNECSTWYSLTSDRKGCASSAFGWGVAFIIIACVVFLCIVAIIIEILLLMYQKHEIKIQRKRDSGIFSTKHCEEELKPCASMPFILSNVTTVKFDEVMELNKEYAKGFYIGNDGTEPIEAVIDIPQDERFGINFMPLSAVLEPKKCAFFTCFFTPYCSSSIELPFKIKIKDENEVKGEIEFKIEVKTEETKNIDSNDLKITETIKETTDIIIYKGTYKNETVKIREIGNYNCDGEDEKLQYELPYKMLEMFQTSEFIGKYIGKCLFENRHLVVTEFASNGTMQDILNKKTKLAVGMRNRIIFDVARGLQLIHSKSFLHYNIKPSNILIMNTDDKSDVVAKITDFGYEYNAKKYHKKMLIHIDERPIYVAPEIFNGQKYTSQSDVYSFGMCMYVIQTLEEPYTDSKFKEPWNIAQFVSEGNRLPKPDDMNKTMFEIIANSWEHCCADRYSMDEVVGNLKKLINAE